jgi:PEGA domain
MGSRTTPFLTSLLVTGTLLVATSGAQERSAPAGAVTVRPVQVREVRVNQPPPSRHEDQRPSFGLERPVDPGFISRPVPRPQSSVNPHRQVRRNSRGRKSFYDFKPRFNTGYGVVVGYPVIYPYAYPYDPFSPSPVGSYTPAAPLRNTYSNVATSSSAETVTAAPPLTAAIECDGSACGGVSFDITPASAQVSVDGVFVGTVDEFSTTSAPLLLAPGDHYIEVRLVGHRTASFDVTIVSGEVTPYQGTLERLRLRLP